MVTVGHDIAREQQPESPCPLLAGAAVEASYTVVEVSSGEIAEVGLPVEKAPGDQLEVAANRFGRELWIPSYDISATGCDVPLWGLSAIIVTQLLVRLDVMPAQYADLTRAASE